MSFTKSDLSMSTAWNYARARSGEELLDQLLALGFERAELNYQVREEWLPAVERYIAGGQIKISSVHNVFPKTNDERFDVDSVLLGYPDEALRRQAVELGKRSIDWACRLGAGAVVFHPTEAPLAPQRYDVPLKRLVAAHKADTHAFFMLQREMLEARQALPYLSQAMRSMEELAEYVVKNGLPVRLGMENRAMCHQIPIFSEWEMIVERFAGSPVGIWLDTGHAIMMQELGLQALPLSQKAAQSLVGMHIHDAVDALDHYAPCTLEGNVLEPFRPYIEGAPIRVLEISGRISAPEVLLGTERFVKRYGE